MVLSQWPGITEGLHDFLYEFTGTNRSEPQHISIPSPIKELVRIGLELNSTKTIRIMMVNLGMIYPNIALYDHAAASPLFKQNEFCTKCALDQYGMQGKLYCNYRPYQQQG